MDWDETPEGKFSNLRARVEAAMGIPGTFSASHRPWHYIHDVGEGLARTLEAGTLVWPSPELAMPIVAHFENECRGVKKRLLTALAEAL